MEEHNAKAFGLRNSISLSKKERSLSLLLRFSSIPSRIVCRRSRRGACQDMPGRPLGNQKGQAIVEYILVLIIAVTFTHQVF